MIRKWSKTINWIMIVALFLSVLPAGIASAADSTIRYFTFADISESKLAPYQVTSGTMDIVGEFNGVNEQSISYQIDSINLKKVGTAGDESDYVEEVLKTRKGVDVKPIIEGGRLFRFTNVKLEPGLNRITIFGTNKLGNTVESPKGYVRYSSAPIVYDVKSADGRVLSDDLTKPTVVDSKSVMLKAENVTEVTVMGKKMFSGDGKTFVASELPLKAGVNTMTFVATNGNMKQTLTRSVVYYSGSPMPYNIISNDNQKLENDAVVGNPTSPFSASVVYKYEPGKPENFADIKFKLTRPLDPSEPTDPTDPAYPDLTQEVTVPANDPTIKVTKDTRFITFSFDSVAMDISYDGLYTLEITGGEYGSQKINKKITFKNQSSGGSFITDIQVANNVIINSDKTIKYDSSTPLVAGTTFLNPRQFLIVTTNTDGATVNLTAKVSGIPVTDPDVFKIDPTTYSIEGAANKKVILVEAMPVGLMHWTFSTIDNETEIPVTYVASSYIDITNVQNGTVFSNSSELEKIEFNLVNFTADDLISNPLKATYNGADISISGSVDGPNELDIKGNPMKPGSNTITISGVAGGVPVSTTLTFYLFSKFTPQVISMIPVPYDEISRRLNDAGGLFKPAGQMKFTTYEKNADVIAIVRNIENLEISVSGTSLYTGSVEDIPLEGTPEATKVARISKEQAEENGVGMVDDNGDPVYDYKIRIMKQFGVSDPKDDPMILPKSGSRNIMIIGHKGTSTVTQTLEIVRELPPFLILSPKLPQENVVTQNFLNVSIEAEGADQILIGKTEMKKDAKRDIFRTNVPLTKAGNNTIKFTVVQGKSKINGSFVVNYSAEKVQGAQYMTQLPASGKLTAFKGDVTIALPKGTVLREANPTPGQVSPSIDLYDKQNILFGIADRKDGRTLKRYNAVGEEDTSGRALDGELKMINADESAIQILTLPSRFGYASDLYWIDAGYMKRDSAGNDKELVSGQLPYKASNEPETKFYERSLNKWLEPTQRGTITMKYDPTILNAASNRLSIWRWVDNDKRWVNLGGTIDAKKKTVTAPFDGFGYYAVLNVRYSFDDVIGHRYARNSLELMMSKNIMKPKDNNEFGVYDTVTRGEFATMLVKILDIPLEYDAENPTFDDVRDFGTDNTFWDFRYVETAVRKGIIRGIAPRVFSPNGTLTREEATTMIARALNLKQGTPEKDLAKLQKTFTDANTIDYYAVGAVLAVSKAGYITGIQNTIQDGAKKAKATFRFDPKSGLTRADAAVIAERIMKKLKKI